MRTSLMLTIILVALVPSQVRMPICVRVVLPIFHISASVVLRSTLLLPYRREILDSPDNQEIAQVVPQCSLAVIVLKINT